MSLLDIVGSLTLAAGLWQNESFGVLLALLGLATGAAGFALQCRGVRCAQCGVAVVWHTFKTRKASQATAAAMLQTVCPNCGYDPSRQIQQDASATGRSGVELSAEHAGTY